MTATPDRADEQALGQVYESVAYDYELLDAIHDGWLVPVEQQMVHIQGLDFSHVHTLAGDLNQEELAEVMESEKNLHGVAVPTLSIIGTSRRAIVFASSVAQAEKLAEVLNRHRPDCAKWLCGKTDATDRRKMLAEFAAGRFQVIVNVGVLTEGFDDAGVSVIVMARPTKSRSLYAQMAGRATRPAGDIAHALNDLPTAEERRALIAASAKPSCLIVDFVGNAGRHKLVTTADILGGKVSEEALSRAIDRAKRETGPVRIDEVLDAEEEKLREEEKRRREEEIARRIHLTAKAKWSSQVVDPFDALDLSPIPARGWDNGRVISEKQANILRKQGIDPMTLPYHQARQLLNELFRRWDNHLATYAQCKQLRKHGLSTDVTMAVASQLIDAVKAAGWRRPPESVIVGIMAGGAA